MKNKNQVKWGENENKAISMTDKFIDILKKLDCWNSWDAILMERIINKKINDSGLKAPNFKDISDMLEYNFGFRILKGNSLAEDMKIEAFLNELKENPYQLNLI